MRLFLRSLVAVCMVAVTALLASCISINPGALPHVTPTPPSQAAFSAELIAALVGRDTGALQSMMGSPFVLAQWQGEAQALAPEAAIAQLSTGIITGTTSLTFVAPDVIQQWMSGVDPLTLWPAPAQPVGTIGISGLGLDGNGQALLVIAEYPTGGYYWYAMLWAPQGFGEGGPPTPIVIGPTQPQGTILPTDVQTVLILGSIGIFDGPGAEFNQVGTTVRGQTYQVVGVSPDGQWWAVVCGTGVAVPGGVCWISANPTFVQVVAGGPTPTATATPLPPPPTATPVIPPAGPTRLLFGPGSNTAIASGIAGPTQSPQFIFNAVAGQQVRILLPSNGNLANFSVRGWNDGLVYKSPNDPAREWSLILPRSQDYLITVFSPANTGFTLEVNLAWVAPPTVAPPTATPTRTPAPAQPERIQFAPGQERAVRNGPLWANTPKQYVFAGSSGQSATIRLSSPSPAANFSVVGASDGVVYKPLNNPALNFTFVLPRSQDYLITILGPVNTSYTLELIIPRPGPTPQPSPERINFAPGQTSAVVNGTVSRDFPRQYLFRAGAGQTATILLTVPPGSDANFSVQGVSDGVIYKSLGNPAREFSFWLPRSQDYLITIVTSGSAPYTLELTIPRPAVTPTALPPTVVPPTVTPTLVPPPPVERISFAPGQSSATRSGPLYANVYKRYVFGGAAGQTATIQVSSPSPAAFFTVVGVSDGIPYKSMGSSAMTFTFVLPLTQDYLITIGAPVNTSYTLVLTIPPILGPTPTPTATTGPTPIPPTVVPTATVLPTVVPPTATVLPTVIPPTATPTNTPLPTVAPPTATPTDTPTTEPPTATPTLEPPTATPTTEPPTATPTPEPPTPEPPTPVPPDPVPPDPVDGQP